MANIKFKRPASQSSSPAASLNSLEYGEPGFHPVDGSLYIGMDSNVASVKFIKEGADTNYLRASNTIDITTTGNIIAAEFSADIGIAVDDGYGFSTLNKNEVGIQLSSGNLLSINSTDSVAVNLDTDQGSNASDGYFQVNNGSDAEVFRVQEDGKVGIGIVPTQKLHVDVTGDKARFILGSADNHLDILKGDTDSQARIEATKHLVLNANNAAGNLQFELNGTEEMRLTKQGAGTGTCLILGDVYESPSADAKLLIKTGQADVGLYIEADDDNDTETASPMIRMSQDGNLVQYSLGIEGGAVGGTADGTTFTNSLSNYPYLMTRDTTNTTGLGFQIATQPSGAANETPVAAITIKPNGEVGIGTNAPLTDFEVKGQALVQAGRGYASTRTIPISYQSEGDAVFAIDPTINNDQLAALCGLLTSEVEWETGSDGDDAPGGYAIKFTGASRTIGGHMSGCGFPFIPIEEGFNSSGTPRRNSGDLSATYYAEMWVKSNEDGPLIYAGSSDYDHDFGAPESGQYGNPGDYGYWMLNSVTGQSTNPGGLAGLNTWTKLSGYISGFHDSSMGYFESGSTYFSPMALINWGSSASSTSKMWISGWKVYKVSQHHKMILQSAGDVALELNADTDNTGENDNPLIKLTQDGNIIQGHIGITGQVSTVPVYTNSIDNTMYIAAIDTFQIATYTAAAQMTAALTILNNQKVGLGTNAPTETLHVIGTAKADAVSAGSGTGAEDGYGFDDNGNHFLGLQYDSGSGGTIHLNSYGDTVVNLDTNDNDPNKFIVRARPTPDSTSGNIDVLEVDETGLVTIRGAGDTPTGALKIDPSGGSSDYDAIKILVNQEVSASLNFVDKQDSGQHFKITYDASVELLKFTSYYSSAVTDNVLVLRNTGNVGIGLEAPLAPLHIFKDIGAPDDLGDFDNSQLVIQGGADSGDTTGILFSSSQDYNGGSAIVHYDTGGVGKGKLAFYTKQTTAVEPPVEVMTLGDDGNVGIGISTAREKLEINGGNLRITNDDTAPETGTGKPSIIFSEDVGQANAHARITYNGDPAGGSNYLALACGDGSGGYSSDTDGDLWVADTGAVGIGTGAPNESSVKNYSVTGISLTIQGEAGLPLNTNTEIQDASLRIQATADNVMDMGCESVSPFAAWIQVTNRDNLSLEYPLLLNPNGGNVGIGTTTPAQTLDVAGVIAATTFSGSGASLTNIPNGALTNNSVTVAAGAALNGGGTVVLGGSISLGVGVDDATIEINSDALRIKADGVKDSHVDFGTGSGQVSTSVIPEGTNKYYTDGRVQANRIDQLAAPSNPVSFGSQRITNLAAPTANADASTKLYVDTEISDLIGGAPGALDTLNELAAAIGDDASYASGITTLLAGKAALVHDHALADLSNVSSATPSNLQALTWQESTSTWVPKTQEWTETGSALHPSDSSGAQNVFIGGTSSTDADIQLFASGAAIFNNLGEDVDFRVAGDTDPNLLFINAGLDKIGIGQDTPTDKLHVQGTIRGNAIVTGDTGDIILHTDGTAEFNRNSEDINFQVQGNNDTHLLWIDGGTDKVGIGVAAPAEKLDVAGTVKSTALLVDPAGGSSDFDAIKIGVDQEVSASIKFYDNDAESTEHYKVTYGAGGTTAGVLKFHSDSYDNVLQMNEAGIIGVNVEAATTTADRWNNGGGRFIIRSSGPNSITTTLPGTSGNNQTGCALRLETSYIPHANVMDFGLNSNAPHQGWIQMCNRASLGYSFFLALNPNGGNISINRPDNSYPLHVGNGTGNGNGAYCTTGGVWTDASTRASKDNIAPLSETDAIATIMALKPKTYNYKNTEETHVGFIAEDVPDLVASEDRKGLSPMDIVAVLTKVMQKQSKTLDKQNKKLSKQQRQINKLIKSLKVEK